MIAIQEIKDLETLPIDQLIRSLITHEMMLGDDQNKKKNGTALKATMETKEKLGI